MDIAVFRAAFPEFTDTAVYPAAQITFWSAVAEKLVNQDVWQDMYINAVQLLTAHEITLATQNRKAAAIGGIPGGTSGQQSSKTVGSVSVAYDTTSSAEKDAGYYNSTIYGKQFYHLTRLFGAGAMQL